MLGVQSEVKNFKKIALCLQLLRNNLFITLIFFYRFLSDFRDLTSWINDTKAVIGQDELAKDVNGAEALLERHAEHKSEIGKN